MPKKAMEVLTESMFYVLMAFHAGPMCGMDIAAYIQRRTQGRICMGPATLYTILSKFERENWIQEVRIEGRKRTYRLTERGRSAYEAELKRLRQCVADAEEEESP